MTRVSGWEGKITTYKKNYQQKHGLISLYVLYNIFRFKFPCITYVSYIGLYTTPLVHTVQYSTVPLYRMGDWPTRGKLKQTNFTDSHKIIENNTGYTQSTYYSLSTGP